MNKRKLLSFCVNVDKAAHLFWKFTYRRYATASFTQSKHPWVNQLWSIYYLHIWCSVLNAELNCTVIYIPTETLAFNLNKIFSVCSIWFCNREKYGLALRLSTVPWKGINRSYIENMCIRIYRMLRIWQLFYATLKLRNRRGWVPTLFKTLLQDARHKVINCF